MNKTQSNPIRPRHNSLHLLKKYPLAGLQRLGLLASKIVFTEGKLRQGRNGASSSASRWGRIPMSLKTAREERDALRGDYPTTPVILNEQLA